MTPETLTLAATWSAGAGCFWVVLAVSVRYAWDAWVMGTVCYRLAGVLRDAPGAPCGAVPFGHRSTLWWAVRRGLRPRRTQRQVAFIAARMGRWEPWMGQPSVR